MYLFGRYFVHLPCSYACRVLGKAYSDRLQLIMIRSNYTFFPTAASYFKDQ